jgi:hypothetical protein
VIVGAGASYDCASDLVDTIESRRPPLVKNLFAKDFAGTLVRYPLAQAAAADIRPLVAPENENAVRSSATCASKCGIPPTHTRGLGIARFRSTFRTCC